MIVSEQWRIRDNWSLSWEESWFLDWIWNFFSKCFFFSIFEFHWFGLWNHLGDIPAGSHREIFSIERTHSNIPFFFYSSLILGTINSLEVQWVKKKMHFYRNSDKPQGNPYMQMVKHFSVCRMIKVREIKWQSSTRKFEHF